jgi:serine/threonine-protein kinase
VKERRYSETVAVGVVMGSDPDGGELVHTGNRVGLIVSRGPERYQVPSLVGLPPEQATTRLADTNLQVAEVKQAFDDTVPIGQVARTDPAANTEVRRDAKITLVVSKGPKPVELPNFRGQSRTSVEDKLRSFGLTADVTTEFSEAVGKGLVISQSPSSGTTVPKGSGVKLVVSDGPPPVPVPSVVDMQKEQAIATLRGSGFDVKVNEGIVTPLNRVYAQEPRGGASAPRGSTITITIF